MINIYIAKDFSEKPFGRYPSDGKWSGERFRNEKLIPAFKVNKTEKVKVHLDGVKRGYGSSFLEESFGGLIRVGIDKDLVKKLLELETTDRDYKIEIMEYIDNA
jgi:hypothetical protein